MCHLIFNLLFSFLHCGSYVTDFSGSFMLTSFSGYYLIVVSYHHNILIAGAWIIAQALSFYCKPFLISLSYKLFRQRFSNAKKKRKQLSKISTSFVCLSNNGKSYINILSCFVSSLSSSLAFLAIFLSADLIWDSIDYCFNLCMWVVTGNSMVKEFWHLMENMILTSFSNRILIPKLSLANNYRNFLTSWNIDSNNHTCAYIITSIDLCKKYFWFQFYSKSHSATSSLLCHKTNTYDRFKDAEN